MASRGVALSAVVAAVALSLAGCGGSKTPVPEGGPVLAEFFRPSDGGYVFERIDRSAGPGGHKGDGCFTDLDWATRGAPFKRGDHLSALPAGLTHGVIDLMGQCLVGHAGAG